MQVVAWAAVLLPLLLWSVWPPQIYERLLGLLGRGCNQKPLNPRTLNPKSPKP